MVLAELGGKLRDSLRKLSSHDESSITTDELNSLLTEITRALIESDVNVKMVMTLRNNIKTKVGKLIEEGSTTNIYKTLQRSVVSELVNMLSSSSSSSDNNNNNTTKHTKLLKGRPNVVMFVGLQGAGKTTTIAKFAHYYQRRGWKTAMVCADTFRAGAFDQLKQNATKLRVPFYGSYTEADPVSLAEDGVRQFLDARYELILVDTSGRHRQESALFEEMRELVAATSPTHSVFVLDGTQGQAAFDQARAFREAVDVGGVIVTKLDGHARGGGALSAVAATGAPIWFTGGGEHLDDLETFDAGRFVNQLLGYGGGVDMMRGLMDDMKGPTPQQDLMKNFTKGEFSLRDMYNQFQSITKLGPLNKVMNMLPGVPDYLVPQRGSADEEHSTNRLKKFMCMMDSMTDAELDGRVDFHKTHVKTDPAHIESRIRRIARGSGTHPTEVKMLLQCHKQFEGVVNKVGKSGVMKKKGGAAGAAMNNPNQFMNAAQQQAMKRNPQMMQQLQKQMGMNPQMMQNMMQSMGGGRGGMPGGMPDMATMQAMMQQMGGGAGGRGGAAGGGMPDMATMAQMMKGMGMGR